MEWCYILVYDGDLNSSEQDYAESMRAGFYVAGNMVSPLFANVTVHGHGYVVVYESYMPEDTVWSSLMEADTDGQYSV